MLRTKVRVAGLVLDDFLELQSTWLNTGTIDMLQAVDQAGEVPVIITVGAELGHSQIISSSSSDVRDMKDGAII